MAGRIGIPRLDRGVERLDRVEQALLEFIDRLDELPAAPPHAAGIGIAAGEFRVGFGRACLPRASGVAHAFGPSLLVRRHDASNRGS